ncbi:MAG: HAD family hydrolase [Thermodesulfobacteriota bacterium]
MKTKKIKAVIFDCDGVMFDTADANRRYYNEVLAEFGKPALNDDQFEKVHMYTVQQALEFLFPEREDLEEVYRCLKGIGYQKFIEYMRMAPGLRELIGALRANRYIVGVATNRTDTMEKVLRENDLLTEFDIVVTAADVENPKPAPDQLQKIMGRFGLRPEEIFFVGDSEFDMLAAENAGAVFAAFSNPDLRADHHVEKMEEIGKILQINEQ